MLKYSCGACVAVLALAACAGDSPPPGEGALELRFSDVPTCIERDGDVCVDHVAQFRLTGDGTEVTFESGPGGRYATTVPAGEYELQVLDDERCVTPDHLSIQEGARHRSDIVWPSAC